jgi:hypothetical protein
VEVAVTRQQAWKESGIRIIGRLPVSRPGYHQSMPSTALFTAFILCFFCSPTTYPSNKSTTMPVRFNVANHPSNPWPQHQPLVATREELFSKSCPTEAGECSRIIQSSVSQSTFQDSHIAPSKNGFVISAWQAYSSHHHLTIRPDDIWFAILSQLNFYINKNAEALRDHFVAHEGQKELTIQQGGTIDTVDFGVFARSMTGLIQENVKDPDLRDWIMPAFSTTTVDDRTTAAVLMMGSLQAYFKYTSMLTCGIPSVTLLGERADYEDILKRLDKLDQLGPEPSHWATLLRPILRKFVASFDEVMSAEVQIFWSRIAHYEGGSGISYLSGWLTAFCFWRNDGRPMYYRIPLNEFPARHTPVPSYVAQKGRYELDNVTYHTVDTNDIPSGFASVPVKVIDNGRTFRTKMVAGSLGINITRSGEKADNGEDKWDSVRSLSGWVMYALDGPASVAAEVADQGDEMDWEP